MVRGSDGEDRNGVAYVRVSKVGGRDDDLLSPELQEYSIREFAAREGITIVEVMTDLDRSGRDFTRRRVSEIIQGIKDGRWQFALLWKWSRWGRDMRQSQLYLGQVEEAGGVVRASTEDFDPQTTIGRFTRDQMLSIAQLQSDMISDGWKEVKEKRRRDGLPHDGRARWGYNYERGKGFTPNPDQEQALKDAYERYVSGESAKKIALAWNAEGLRTTGGKLWTPDTLVQMLDTGFAAGLLRERSGTAAEKRKARRIWDFDIWRTGVHDTLIDMEMWEAYKARRRRQADTAPRLRTPPAALSGLMACGHEGCGGPMQVHYSGRDKKRVWYCRRARDTRIHEPNRLRDKFAFAEVLEWVESVARASNDVTEEAQRIDAAQRAQSDATAYTDRIAKLTARRKRLVQLYLDEEIERGDYLAQKGEITADLEAAGEALRAAKQREKAAGGSIIRKFERLAVELPGWEPQDQNEALSQVVQRFLIMPNTYGPKRVKAVPAWEE